MRLYSKALTVAGSDSGGGAGIQADLKTFHALGVYGLSAITALTAQNTVGVFGIESASPDFFTTQMRAVLSDIVPDATKTGMLANAEIVKITSDLFKEYKIKNIVVDPVMVSKHGAKLLEDSAIENCKRFLFPIAHIITPNLSEAALLTGADKITTKEEMKKAAVELLSTGCGNVVVKGGHLEGDKAADLFYDGANFIWLIGERFDAKHTHGTGCTFSAAIASFLAKGEGTLNAVKLAKGFISNAIASAYPVGGGIGPVNHLWAYQNIDRATMDCAKIHKD